jgi:hypothetical protein
MSMCKQRVCQMALAVSAALWAGSAASAASSVQAVSVQDAELLTGGVGEREREELLARAPDYDLFVRFAGRKSGAYVSNVRVTFTSRALDRPIELTTNGPLLLANLPEGRYEITADLPGWKPRERNVEIERGQHQDLWITFITDSGTH